MDNIDDMLKSIDDALGNKNPDQPKDLKQTLLDQIDSAIGVKPEAKKEEVVTSTQPTAQPIAPPISQSAALPSPVPQATPVAEKKSTTAYPSAVPSPVPQPTPPKEKELDLSKPSNQIFSIVGNKKEEEFNPTDFELLNTLTTGRDLYEFKKLRPDISLNSLQQEKIFEYLRETTPWKIPEKAEDWFNLGKASLELIGKDLPVMVSDITGSFLKGGAKAIKQGVPFVLGQTSDYAEALEAEKLLPPEKRQEVEQWRQNAWRIANTPLKGGEKPNPNSYTDALYLEKVRAGLAPEQVAALNQKYEQKRAEAKQVPFEVTSELASLPESLAFMEAKVSEGGIQLWDTISEQAGLIDKEKAFERFMAREAVDTAKAKMQTNEPRAYARVVDTYFKPAATAIQSSYIPGFSAYTSLFHPSIEEYMITYPELTREEAKAKRQNEIENNVLNYLEDVKKTIPETDPDLQMLGSLAMPGQFGLDTFGYAVNVVEAAKALTPLAKSRFRKMLYTDDQINAIEAMAQRALKERELKKLEKKQTPGIIEKTAGSTAKGIEATSEFIEKSPTFQKISNIAPYVTGAGLGYQFDPENPLRGMVAGGFGGAAIKFGLEKGAKALKETPKVIKEIQAARRISAGGEIGPLATLESIAKQQDEVKKLTAELKNLSEGTQEYIDTKKLLDDAKEKAKGIKAGGTEVVDYEGIGKVSDTTKNILKFVSDDIVSNVGEYAKLLVEPTLLGLATGIIDSSDEEELKAMIGQGLVFSIGGRALQQGYHQFIGEDPVVAARKARQVDVDALKTYRDSTPETREEINKLTDWNNVLERQSNKINEATFELQGLQNDRAAMVEKNKNDPNFWNNDEFKNIDEKIKKLEKVVTSEQKSLSLLKTANVQTRNEFGRNFLHQLARNNMRLNGSLRSGQNNVGFNILSTQQIFDHFRNNPSYRDFSDADIMTAASQQGFYSGIGGSEFNPGASVTDSTKGLIFDPNKPSIVINSDSLRNRMMLFGETPTEALNHETGHHILKIKEIQDAVADARNILFTNEIRDASGNVKEISNGLYTSDDLNKMFSKNYLKNRSKEEIAQISQSIGLWDYNTNSLNPELVKNYMQEEILADMFANTLSRNVAKDLNDKRTHLFDVANLKMKNGLLKSAVTKMLGYGLSSDVVSEATNANISPEAQSAARNAMRLLESMNGDFTSIASLPQTTPISKAEIKKSKIAAERYGMDSGLFETKTVAQVFDENGKPIGTPIDVTDPAAFEGSWRIKSDGEERLSGYGQIPVSLRQLQVPNGGTLSISKKIVTEADGETPKLLKPEDLKKLQKDRASLFKQAIDTPDYGTPGRFEAVSEGSETYRGSFTPMQIKAIQDLPEGIVPLKIKKYLLDLNDAIVKKDGTRFYMDYAAVMDDKGNYKAFSPKIYDVVPIGLHLSQAGNFLVTTISVGRLMEKLNLWGDRMPNRLDPWSGSKTAFWNDFSTKYLDNWTKGIEGSGYNKQGEAIGNTLDSDVQKAEIKKDILNDFLNLATNDTRDFNLDRTTIPRRKGDPKNKSLDRTIGSMRIDHIAELLNAEYLTKLPIDYGKAKINFMPERMEGEVPVRKDWDEMLNKSLKMSYDEFVSLAKKGKLIQATGEKNPFVAGTGETPLSYGAGAGYSLEDIVHFYSLRTAPMDAAYNNFLDNAEFEKISKKGVKMSYDEFISSTKKGVQFMPAETERYPTSERGMYSGLQNTIDEKVQGKFASPDQLKAIVTNLQNVKAEELKWSGVLGEIDRLAQENNGKVPKDKVMDYLRNEGAVKFEEVTLGGKEPFDANRLAELEAEYKKLKQHPIDDPSFGEDKYDELIRLMNIRDQSTTETLYDEAERVMNLAQQAQRRGDKKTAEKYFQENEFLNTRAEKLDLQGQGLKNPPKYAQYQLPGNTNYREVVMTMPNKIVEEEANLKKQIFELNKQQSEFEQQSPEWNEIQKQLRGLIDRQSDLVRMPSSERAGYTSSHFPDIPNYVAHARVNDRVDAKGRKGRFIEEFQSDLHQAGRDVGYIGEKLDIPEGYRIEKSPIRGFIIFDSQGNSLGGKDTEIDAIQAARMNAGLSGAKMQVPDAPFRKDWPLQIFKRQLRDAVDAGEEWIGWTTGDTQAERYDLSKQVDSVNVSRGGGNTWEIWADKDGQKVADKNVNTINEVAEVIGKDLAKKVEDMKPGESARTFSGLDLKVGGEGMKGFYDTILPKEIGKYVAKMGGKVEKSGIDTGDAKLEQWISGEEAMTMNGIPQSQQNEMWKGMTQQERTDYLDSARKQKFKDQKQDTTPIWEVNITPEMAGKVRAGQLQFMPEKPTEYEPISARIRPLQGISAPTKVVGAKAPVLGEIEPPVRGKAMLPDMELKPIGEKPSSEMMPSKGQIIFEEGVKDSQGNGQYVDRIYGTDGSIEWDYHWDSQANPFPRIRWSETSKQGAGKTLYLEALSKVKSLGKKGLKSDPITNEDEGTIGPTPRAIGAQQSLEKRGLITITKSKDGSRLLEITPKGEKFLQKDKIIEPTIGEKTEISPKIDADYMKAVDRNEIEPPVMGKAMLPDMELKPDISEKGIQSSDIITSAKPAPDAVIKLYSNALVSSAGLINFLPAYHGTPHEIPIEEGFKMSQVGTGEGAQAYGHGLYFAQARKVGESYRDQFQEETQYSVFRNGEEIIPKNDKEIKWIFDLIDFQNNIDTNEKAEDLTLHDIEYELNNLKDDLLEEPNDKSIINKIKELEEKYKFHESVYVTEKTANLYKVDLDVKDEDLLDWDKPLSEQSERIQTAIKSIDRFSDVGLDNTGKDIYDVLSNKPWVAAQLNADWQKNNPYQPKIASEKLLAAGIPGIRYLDGMSRGVGEGTYNYVIFDENLIKILDKNDKPVEGDLPKQAPLTGLQFMPVEGEEKITETAVINKDGNIISSPKKNHSMIMEETDYNLDAGEFPPMENFGFLTNTGRFVTQKEAQDIAKKSNQVIGNQQISGEIVSAQNASIAFLPESIDSSTSVKTLTDNENYNEAKYNGNPMFGYNIAKKYLTQDIIDSVNSKIDPEKPAVIIPVSAFEGEDMNTIPLAVADALSWKLNIPVSTDIVKSSSAHNTGATAEARSRTIHNWDGKKPAEGTQIILVDDTYTTGQTLKSLANYVGEPTAIVTLASSRYGKQFDLSAERENKMLAKAGITRDEFISLYGKQPNEKLTGAQAQQYLLNGKAGKEGLLTRFPSENSQTEIRPDKEVSNGSGKRRVNPDEYIGLNFTTKDKDNTYAKQMEFAFPKGPKTLTYFSGIGTWEQGLKGEIDPQYAVEYDPAKAAAYRAANGDHMIEGDVTQIDPQQFKGIEYFHASPVCKNYSILKDPTRGGEENDLDIRSADAVNKVLKTCKPKFFTLENVGGYRKSDAYESIKNTLLDLGYKFDDAIYNANEYGSPTDRKRLLLRATLGDDLPAPIKHQGGNWYDTVADIVNDLPDAPIKGANFIWRELNKVGIDPENVPYPILIAGGGSFKQVPWRSPDEPAYTFTTNQNNVDRILLPGGISKRVTGRAKARMSGFDDSLVLPENDKLANIVIGNGVPPDLVKNVIGPMFTETTNKKEK